MTDENELGRIYKEVVVALYRYYPSQCLKGMKTMKACQDNQCPGQDLNQVPPKYESRALPLEIVNVQRQSYCQTYILSIERVDVINIYKKLV
jgi:hypothetical protein